MKEGVVLLTLQKPEVTMTLAVLLVIWKALLVIWKVSAVM